MAPILLLFGFVNGRVVRGDLFAAATPASRQPSKEAVTMADNGGSGVNALAIIAILILVGIAGYWFYYNQNSGTRQIDVNVETPAPPAPSTP